MITRWKDLSKDYDKKDKLSQKIAGSRFPKKKKTFRASKWLWKFRTQKTAKNSKLCYN